VRLSLLLPSKQNIKKRYRKRWMASFLGRRNQNLNIVGDVGMDSCSFFRNFTRMTASDFELLLQLIGLRVKKQDTNWRGANPGGVQQIQLRTEGRENGDLGAVAPSQGFNSICK
jgi:hypothetical protein